MRKQLIDILGEDDYQELRSEVSEILHRTNCSIMDRYLDIEQLMTDWGVDPDYMDELLPTTKVK